MKTVVNLLTNGNDAAKAKKAYMYINVILTFDTPDRWGDMQECFDLHLPLNKNELCAVQFTHKKLFKRIVKKCALYKRSVGDLVKISTAGNWDLFEATTGKESLPDLGHSCKWFFGNGRSDLDLWEKALIKNYGFGVNIDMSHITPEWISMVRANIEAYQEKSKQKISIA